MSYCETCKGPHQPKRKIPASRLALAWYASRFIYERGAPGFLDAIRQMIPSAKDMSDQEIVTWVGDSTQCLRDLLDVFIDPETRLLRVSAAEFLVLRGATLGDGVPRITVSEEAPASVVVGFPGDDHGMAGAVWMVDRQSARDQHHRTPAIHRIGLMPFREDHWDSRHGSRSFGPCGSGGGEQNQRRTQIAEETRVEELHKASHKPRRNVRQSPLPRLYNLYLLITIRAARRRD